MVDVFDPNKIENTEFTSRSGMGIRDAFSVPRARVSARQLPRDIMQAVGSGVLSGFGVDRPLRVEKRQAQLTQGTIQDARQIKRAIENENTNEAISILVDRMNILDRMGEDTSDTRMLRDALVAGRPDVVMREVNTFLNSLPVEYIDPDMVTEQGQMISRRAGGAPIAEAVGGFEVKPQEPQDQYRPLTAAERAAFNIPDTGSYRINTRTGKPERIGGDPLVRIGDETDPYQEMQLDALKSMLPDREEMQSNRQAIETFGRVEQMAALLNANDMSGAERLLRSMFPDLSVSLADDQGLIATAQAIQTQVAPQMRVAGSGSTSDMEFKAYLGSLPSLIQSPAGRNLLVETFRPAKERAQKRMELFRQYGTGKITVQQYLEEIEKLDSQELYTTDQKRRINGIAGTQIFEIAPAVFVEDPNDDSIKLVQ